MSDAEERRLSFWSGQEDGTFERLMAAPRIALDTESDPFHRYFERVCLIQLSDSQQDWLFDPLEHKTLPSGMRRLLCGDGPVIVMHGAESDVRSLKQSFSTAIGPLFDTQLAAQLLGKEKFGLKDLLFGELGVEIDKGEQRSDWGRRPLTRSQIAYARQDTRDLLALADALEAQLLTAGRQSWHEEECVLVRDKEPTEKHFDPESWRKIKGSRDLGPVGRRALLQMVAWRDGVARAEDRPAFRIMRSDALLRIAFEVQRHGEKTIPELMNGRIVPKGTNRMELQEAIIAGLRGPDPGKNRPRSARDARKPPKSPQIKARMDALRQGRTEWAAMLGLDPGFLLPATLLERIARESPRNVAEMSRIQGLTEWRRSALSESILAALAVMEAPKGC